MTWILLQFANNWEYIDINFAVCAIIAAVILVFDMALGLPAALILSRRCSAAWAHALTGAFIGLSGLSFWVSALASDWYQDHLDREGTPISVFTMAWSVVEAVGQMLFTTSSSLIFILPGAAGGLGYWLARRGWGQSLATAIIRWASA